MSGRSHAAQAVSFALIYVSYMVFYFNRKNYAFWLNELVRTVGRPKDEVSLFGSAMELSYGAGKLIAGPFVDSAPPALVLAATLAITGLCNVAMFQSGSNVVDLALWSTNGVVQSAAWPALAAIFMNWFEDSPNRGIWYSILSTNQNLGSALCPILLTPIVQVYGWRAATWAPGFIGLSFAAVLGVFLRNGPSDDTGEKDKTNASASASSQDNKASSKQTPSPANSKSASWTQTLVEMCTSVNLLSLGIGYACLQALRVGVQDWTLIILQENRGVALETARDCMVALEFGGFVGGISAGAFSDRLFRGRRGPVIVLFTALLAPLMIAIASFPFPKDIEALGLAGLYFLFGFLSFGPHMLVGLTGTVNRRQIGGTAAGYPLSIMVNWYGWAYVNTIWTLCAVFGALAFSPLLRVPAANAVTKTKKLQRRSALSVAAAQLVWAAGAHALTTPGLRGDGGDLVLLEDEDDGRMLADSSLPWWFFLLMPIISGIVGYGTNVVALKLTFGPLQFWGIELFRIKNEPLGCIGWQGIVPTKAEKMASDSVDLMTEKLFNIREIFGRIEKEKAALHLEEGFEVTLTRVVDKLADEYIIEKTTAWKRTESAVKEQIKSWSLAELPSFTAGFMSDLVDNLDEVYDLKHMCVREMVLHPDLLVDVFKSVGAKELRFIENSGFYLGFLFGCVQTILFRWAIPTPISDYLLPALGAFVGYFTNLIALKAIFQPIEPRKICCGRVTLHGLFLKRQQVASAKFASKMVATVLHSKNIWWYMMNGPKSDKFEALLRSHADSFTDRLIGFSRPLVERYMGPENFAKMRGDIQDMTVNEIENIIQFMHDYTDQALDLETEIRVKMQALPSAEFERVLHPVFEEDEFKLILVGTFLGALVGLAQMMVSFAIVGEYFPSV
ncbi:Sugar phosphate exchanger 3 [Hondaea fermentalgiana]|uniref:Sugar phosphate exchanger 3 n=1 Tax=Hondaea fermentalgiana TaxID=2315210 RepID=A0A2R5GAS8_9STRA|nr:Sugar phosphate exchanger 3 [Hondaea fermentalgiana]|eukprot:GBG28116.1 Sugar phosphate exchanger 3 [Hondaea fermentalgiana]